MAKNKTSNKAKITLINYNKDNFEQKSIKRIEDCFPLKDKGIVAWINIEGANQADIIEKIGKHFNIHHLILEDILDAKQRPNIKYFEDYISIALKMIFSNIIKSENICMEQVSLILGSNFVISFQEGMKGDVFNSIRERIKDPNSQIRKARSDYLCYSLVNAIISNYFVILEKLGERIEVVGKSLAKNPTVKNLQSINNLKNSLIFLRRSIWPLREIVLNLEKAESVLIEERTGIYFKDLYDHIAQIMDIIETFREMLSGMLDVYLSSINNRTNSIMKVLTIISTIFIPLTFITGVYGMNFRYMPELQWRWGYFMIVFIMVFIGVFMLVYFKKKKWL